MPGKTGGAWATGGCSMLDDGGELVGALNGLPLDVPINNNKVAVIV